MCATGFDCGEWPGREAELARLVLEHLQRHAALGGGLHVVGVDAQDPVHPAEPSSTIESGTCVSRPPSVAVPPGARDDVDPVLVREGEHRGDVLRCCRPSPPPRAAAA